MRNKTGGEGEVGRMPSSKRPGFKEGGKSERLKGKEEARGKRSGRGGGLPTPSPLGVVRAEHPLPESREFDFSSMK